MWFCSIAFLLGIILLQYFSYLPDKKWVGIIVALVVPTCFCKKIRLLSMAAFGFAYCLWYVHCQMAWTLPEDFESKPLIITGYIVSIPHVSQESMKFLFAPQKMQSGRKAQFPKGLLRLTWRQENLKLKVGDQWRLVVRLKRIHSTLNPGGFDYEAHALQEGVRAVGYVVKHVQNQLLSSECSRYSLSCARQFLKDKMEENLPKSHTAPWIIALVLGERYGISPEDWEILRHTGTNHLMAIAGLHIGLMSGFAAWIVSWLWKYHPYRTLKMPAQQVGAIAAFIMALIYSALAGFSIPTQRACIMLSIFLMMLLLRRQVLPWYAWSLSLWLVLLLNPLNVLTDSFWLSFGAVAWIIYGMSGRLAANGLWWKWGRMQWVISLGLVPLGIGLFQQCSIVSFLANVIAIPLTGFIIVPLCLFGSMILLFSAKLGGIIFLLADKVLSLLWAVLTWFAHLPFSSWYQVVPTIWMIIAAVIGIVLLLLPVGFPGRYLGIVWCLPMILFQPPSLTLGEAWLTLLDVGQGLSAIIQTKNHILVFDAGPKLSESYDMGESVVVPFLRSINAKRVDMLVVSHADNDHRGGVAAILKYLPVFSIKTSVPGILPHSLTSYCLAGEQWTWDGVNFVFLYPSLDHLGLGNDSSCVLRVSCGNHNILLTGDIEKIAERSLVQRQLQWLPADIVVAPHHGSKTSADNAFLQAVHPQYVLFPIGYRNRFHFPHPSVVAKYDALGSIMLDTVHTGSIQFKVSADKEILSPLLYRMENRRYWND